MPVLEKRPSLLICLSLFLCAVGTTLLLLPEFDRDLVDRIARQLGPVAIVGLVALGIVVSPFPSGLVALVAGALYGPLAGGALTVLGAGLGASCAFALSRCLGRGHLVASSSSVAQWVTRERSQTALMAGVFVTRLIPFISFDAVSYLAGVTPLAFWRFAVATVLGTTPVCFAFAAAGHSASREEMSPLLLAGLTGITLFVPVVVVALSAACKQGGNAGLRRLAQRAGYGGT